MPFYNSEFVPPSSEVYWAEVKRNVGREAAAWNDIANQATAENVMLDKLAHLRNQPASIRQLDQRYSREGIQEPISLIAEQLAVGMYERAGYHPLPSEDDYREDLYSEPIFGPTRRTHSLPRAYQHRYSSDDLNNERTVWVEDTRGSLPTLDTLLRRRLIRLLEVYAAMDVQHPRFRAYIGGACLGLLEATTNNVLDINENTDSPIGFRGSVAILGGGSPLSEFRNVEGWNRGAMDWRREATSNFAGVSTDFSAIFMDCVDLIGAHEPGDMLIDDYDYEQEIMKR